MKNKQNEKGFSLIEVMITLGLVSAIGYGLMSVLGQAQKGQKGIQSKVEFDNLKNSIFLMIQNPSLCTTGFVNAAETTAKYNPTATFTPAQILNTIKLGPNTIIAKLGEEFSPGVKITKLELQDSGVPPITTGTRKTYLAKLVIEADRGNVPGAKTLTNKGNPFLLNVTVNSSNDIVSCGGSETIALTYPTTCSYRFGHRDGSGPEKYAVVPFDGTGHRGIRLAGDVDSNDRFLLRGNCNADFSPLDKFMSTCQIDIGMKDHTDGPGNHNDNPTSTATTTMNQSSSASMGMSGDVDENDSFYFRMRCPETSNAELLEAQEHIFQNCHICFGYSDVNRPQMDTRMCARVSPMSNTAWTRLRFTGDVDDNDIMFPGFYCKNDTGSHVKSITW